MFKSEMNPVILLMSAEMEKMYNSSSFVKVFMVYWTKVYYTKESGFNEENCVYCF